jgi:hypothetical protein
MQLTKKKIMKKYSCDVFKDAGFDDKRKYWVALPNDNNDSFCYADGWTLEELVENIEKDINK